MSLYIDTSALLKLLFHEPESARTIALVQAEAEITISSLTRLEALVQIQARATGGLLTAAKAQERREKVRTLLSNAPFRFQPCPAAVFEIAATQIATPTTYCPSLDRLHLAAMEIFHLRRLLTNDDTQAAAARALGFEVLLPR